jgi:hypothetical protein
MTGSQATTYQGELERGMTKEPIEVTPDDETETMLPASRLRFGKHYSIEWNVKVREIGIVAPRYRSRLMKHYRDEQRNGFDNDEDLSEEDEDEELAAQHTGKDKMKATKKTAQSAAKYADSRIYHAEANPYGYDIDCNPHMFHPKHNPNGYHPESNPHGYHPESNPYMFHPIYNMQGYHPKHNVYGYHPGWNKFGFHHQNSPFCFHPKLNPYGYHSTDNMRGYHPQVMPYNYHPRGNTYGYHPVKNEHGFHPRWNKRGYHPEHNPQAYHPKWNKDGVYRTQKDESDEDEAESLEKGVDPSTADLIKVYPGNNSQEATDVDGSIPMASLHAQIMRKFSFALDKKGGWARDRQDLITQLYDASTRLQHWNHSILGLVDRTLEIFDSGEKKIIDTILSTVENDRPYLAGLIASYFEDILSNLDGLEDIITTDYWTQ